MHSQLPLSASAVTSWWKSLHASLAQHHPLVVAVSGVQHGGVPELSKTYQSTSNDHIFPGNHFPKALASASLEGWPFFTASWQIQSNVFHPQFFSRHTQPLLQGSCTLVVMLQASYPEPSTESCGLCPEQGACPQHKTPAGSELAMQAPCRLQTFPTSPGQYLDRKH